MAFSWRTALTALAPLATAFAVVLAVNLLPADTALDEINAAGRLTVCAPRELGPLVTRDSARPGFELALVEEVARRSGWRVAVSRNVAMGREFNPGNWRISRATCRLMVGGLRDNSWSRSLMEMGQPNLTSSWVWVAKNGETWPPASAAFHPGVVAFDRVALGSALRDARIRALPVQSPAELVTQLEAGQSEAAITDSITAAFQFGASDLTIAPLPVGPEPVGISMGVWKGDTSLRLHLDGVLADMRLDGTLERLAQDYGIAASLMP